jgi:hypothetical protein
VSATQVRFELERLVLTDERELEISGRWRGVRPARFSRPHLSADGRRLRATGSGIDGDTWWARFPWPDPPPSTADIEAGNVVVSLPLAKLAAATSRPASLPARRAESSPSPEAPSPTDPENLRAQLAAEAAALRSELTAAEQRAAEAEARAQRLAREVDTLHEEFTAAADETGELRERFNSECAALREQQAAAQQRIEKLEAELKEARERAEGLDGELKTARRKAKESETEASGLRETLATAEHRTAPRRREPVPPRAHHHHSVPPKSPHPPADGPRLWILRSIAAVATAALLVGLALTLGMCS